MPDMENVIKGLECKLAKNWERGCCDCPYDEEFNCIGCDVLLRDALELLKAQEPVEPKMMEFVDEGVTWEKYELATCGKCGALLGDALYCPMCGQAVKWE